MSSSLSRLRAISIHAPRGGSDDDGLYKGVRTQDFNPRSPWGERPQRLVALQEEA